MGTVALALGDLPGLMDIPHPPSQVIIIILPVLLSKVLSLLLPLLRLAIIMQGLSTIFQFHHPEYILLTRVRRTPLPLLRLHVQTVHHHHCIPLAIGIQRSPHGTCLRLRHWHRKKAIVQEPRHHLKS